MTSCLDEASLLAFGRGEVPAPKRADIESHIAGCEECRVLVSAVRRASLVDSSELTAAAPAPAAAALAIEAPVEAPVAPLAPIEPIPSRGGSRTFVIAACALVLLALALKFAAGH